MMNLIDSELAQKPPLEIVALIADRLGEKEAEPRRQIARIVWALGRTQTLALLNQAEQVEREGGMMILSGERRRTPGGVFFHLAYTTGKPKEGKTLARPLSRKKAPEGQQPARPGAPLPPFTWEDRIAIVDEIGLEKGHVSTVKITLIGRIGKYMSKGDCVVGVMQHTGEKLPTLPKGVPAPQPVKTSYVVYIAGKQWKNVAETTRDPEDVLIVEGFPQIDVKTSSIAVFATSVTSKKLQQAKRDGQQKKA